MTKKSAKARAAEAPKEMKDGEEETVDSQEVPQTVAEGQHNTAISISTLHEEDIKPKETNPIDPEIEQLKSEIGVLKSKEQDNLALLMENHDSKIAAQEDRETKITEMNACLAAALEAKKQAEAVYLESSHRRAAHMSELEAKVNASEKALEGAIQSHTRRMADAEERAGTAPLQARLFTLEDQVSKMNEDYEKKSVGVENKRELLSRAEVDLTETVAGIKRITEESDEKINQQSQHGEEAQREASKITQTTNEKIDESTKTKQLIQQAEAEQKEDALVVARLEGEIETTVKLTEATKKSAVDLEQKRLMMLREIKLIEDGMKREQDQEREMVNKFIKEEGKLKESVGKSKGSNAEQRKQFDTQKREDTAKAKVAATAEIQDKIVDKQRSVEEQKVENESVKQRIKIAERQLAVEKKKSRDALNAKKAQQDGVGVN